MDQYKIAASSSKHPPYQNTAGGSFKQVRRPATNVPTYQVKHRTSLPAANNHQKLPTYPTGKVVPKQKLRVTTGPAAGKKIQKEEQKE